MPARAGQAGVAHGEAGRDSASDEASCPRQDTESTGSALLQAVLTRENLRQAFKRVRANKGAAGVDGLDVDQDRPSSGHGVAEATRTIAAGDVPAQSGTTGNDSEARRRRARARHPDGDGSADTASATAGAAMILDPTFSAHSYGFRPGRRAHDAVLAAQSYVQSGRRIVVDVDLQKFFTGSVEPPCFGNCALSAHRVARRSGSPRTRVAAGGATAMAC